MIIGMAAKTLSEVEVNNWISNQHEFHGVASLKKIFGTKRKYFSSRFFYFSDRGVEVERRISGLTWYDSRENVPTRSSEYRLYYDSDFPQNKARAGDTLLITLDDCGNVNVYLIAKGTQLVNFLMSQLSQSIGANYSIFTDQNELALVERTFQIQ